MKKYKALISQIGTSNPTGITLKNCIGLIWFVRISSGYYQIKSNGKFPENATSFFITPCQSDDDGINAIKWVDESTIEIRNTIGDWSNAGYTNYALTIETLY